MFTLYEITGEATPGGPGGHPPHHHFFAQQKEKMETKEKVEMISKQKLLKGCHQG